MTIEPWHWLVFGMVLVIAEMFIPTFASLWFGTAAILVAGLAWLLPMSLFWQVMIWLILSVILRVAWFRFIKPRAIDRTKAGLGGSAIIGETGMIIVAPYITDNTVQAGKVRFSTPKLGSDEWFCRTEDEMLEVGERVVVTDIIGNELLVTRAKRLNTVKVEQHSIQN